ncbi:hypothetical protein ZWY2020_003330 [Hordeum vulgare]|nr:hypothetical protein ZWY2020_003330 [Hordeum vulgare]
MADRRATRASCRSRGGEAARRSLQGEDATESSTTSPEAAEGTEGRREEIDDGVRTGLGSRSEANEKESGSSRRAHGAYGERRTGLNGRGGRIPDGGDGRRVVGVAGEVVIKNHGSCRG